MIILVDLGVEFFVIWCVVFIDLCVDWLMVL